MPPEPAVSITMVDIHEDIACGYFDGDTNLDVAIGNRFVLTNTAPSSAQFYKLRRD